MEEQTMEIRDNVRWGLLLAYALVACDDGASKTSEQSDGHRSPYADPPPGELRSLTTKEVEDLREGRGMGLARAAELNSYPGPRHVLDMREQLNIDTATAQKLEVVMQRMLGEAKTLGATIVAEEGVLDRAFRESRITTDEVAQRTESLAAHYARLRAVHLEAHLETKALLSEVQIAKYNELRGYTNGRAHQHGS
jgi:ribosomal protein S13